MARATHYKTIVLLNYEFNNDSHDLSLTRGTISQGSLRWKLEMHTTFENKLYFREELNILRLAIDVFDIPSYHMFTR